MLICILGSAKSVHIQRWTEYLVEQKFQVYLISYEWDFFPIKHIKQYIISSSKLKPKLIKNIIELNNIVKLIKPDIINAHYLTKYGFISSFIRFKNKINTTWGSDVLLDPNVSLFWKLIFNFTIFNSKIIHSNGRKVTHKLISNFIKPKIIREIHFGVNIQDFISLNKSPNRSDLRIISTRSLYPVYDISTLLRALKIVISNNNFNHEIKCLILGDGPEASKLKLITDKLQLNSNVEFIGKVKKEDIASYLINSDIYVSTSLSDSSLSQSTGEAMIAGLPVIVTSDPENRLWIKEGKNGLFFDGKNYVTLASQIIKLIQNENLRIYMGQNNQNVIKKYKNHQIQMEKVLRMYKKVNKEK
ncbi:MAG: glycosyltransferase [Candidatus Heimdallarchaeota archaeon]|nr:glycosyltransferase [Candidatus Heimdallarchaeota archaeon]